MADRKSNLRPQAQPLSAVLWNLVPTANFSYEQAEHQADTDQSRLTGTPQPVSSKPMVQRPKISLQEGTTVAECIETENARLGPFMP